MPKHRALRLRREPLTDLELSRVAGAAFTTTTRRLCVCPTDGRSCTATLEDPRCIQSMYSPDCTKSG